MGFTKSCEFFFKLIGMLPRIILEPIKTREDFEVSNKKKI